MKISLCIFAYNDLPWLRTTLAYEMRWADQVCLLDMGSTDGTAEFADAFLRKNDVYVRRRENTIVTLGFAEARNAVMKLADADWLVFSDADRLLDWTQHRRLRRTLERTSADVLSIETWNIPPPPEECSHIEAAAINSRPRSIEHHRLIVRAGKGHDFKGYMHEEVHLGERNCWEDAEYSRLRFYHFENWRDDDDLRHARYAHMLMRCEREPELKRYINKWWFDEYVPQHRADLERMAADYERLTGQSSVVKEPHGNSYG